MLLPIMADTNESMDVKLQICFGIFAVVSLFVAISGLHTHNSLGAAWFRCIRRRLHPTYRRRPDRRLTPISDDEESRLGLFELEAISLPLSRISFDDSPLQFTADQASRVDTDLDARLCIHQTTPFTD